jgi:HAD superfamily hydrolase (TIGR01490 family)
VSDKGIKMTVVFSDVGGTIFEGAPWVHLQKHPNFNTDRNRWEMYKFLPTYGLSKIKFISETTMRQQWLKGMARVFKDMSHKQLQRMFRETLEGDLQPILRHDVIERLQAHKADGMTVILVSGIFSVFVEVIAEYIGIDGAIGTQLEYRNDKTSGRIKGIPCVGTQKIEYINNFMQEKHPDADLASCYAYADSYSDRALLSAVGHGIATYPDDDMRMVAKNNHWEIMPA